jgi:hypothetical protein
MYYSKTWRPDTIAVCHDSDEFKYKAVINWVYNNGLVMEVMFFNDLADYAGRYESNGLVKSKTGWPMTQQKYFNGYKPTKEMMQRVKTFLEEQEAK